MASVEDKDGIAIIGMAGAFPGAATVDQFWANLVAGKETISTFSREELLAAGIPARQLGGPNYVPRSGMLEGIDRFDAAFFRLTGLEARMMDPQHRLLLQASWAAMEDAGYVPGDEQRFIGVFVGCADSAYYERNLLTRPDLLEASDSTAITLGNSKDFLATRISHKLNLVGPALTVQTACSTSLTAVHVACQALLAGECDMALAGGAAIRLLARQGYVHQPGGLLSGSGHCRAFDAGADGTLPGDGLGIVLLKPVAEAIADGDNIRAVILGTAANNDGSDKTGFTAPSVQGQASVIRQALAMADADPRSIGLIEAHGTGTILGDPIEFKALDSIFEASGDGPFCVLGSVKTNIGHLDTAAGIAGLIKAALALEHRKLPPSLHFEAPNPEIPLRGSAFRIVTEAEDWPAGPAPRRAGVSSFGLGGTNVHVVLEEAPAAAPRIPPPAGQPSTLLVSARSREALDRACDRMARHVEAASSADLPDIAFTTQVGRRHFQFRRAFTAATAGQMAELLNGASRQAAMPCAGDLAPIFMFPGESRREVAAELHADHPIFARHFEACAKTASEILGLDVAAALLGRDRIQYLDPSLRGPVETFLAGFALGRLLEEIGVRPFAMIGQGLGEYVAAAMAEVMTVRDAIGLVVSNAGLAPAIEGISLARPRIPLISTVTGDWLSDAQATSPRYWSDPFRNRAELLSALRTASKSGTKALIEAGAGALQDLARQASLEVPTILGATGDAGEGGRVGLRRAIGELWAAGAAIDWSRAEPQRDRRRRSVPGYQFEPESHWVEPASDPKGPGAAAPDAAQGRYSAPSWKRLTPARAEPKAAGARSILLLAPDLDHAERIRGRLDADGIGFTCATPGSSFDPAEAQDYVDLLAGAEAEGPLQILYALGLAEGDAAPERLAVLSLDGLSHLIRAAGGLAKRRTVSIAVLTRGVFSVDGDEPLRPAASLALGPARVAPQEFPKLAVRLIDLDGLDSPRPDSTRADPLAQLLRMDAADAPDTAAIRGRHIWVPFDEEVSPEAVSPPLRDGGHYLITGGLGGLGMAFAEYLAERIERPKITLIGRRDFGDPVDWEKLAATEEADEDLRSGISALIGLQAGGAEISYRSADVADGPRLKAAIEAAVEAHGPIAGLFHAAGLGDGKLLRHETSQSLAATIRPKVAGTLALFEAVAGQDYDFALLCSSLNARWPAIGQTAYCAANGFLDSFAEKQWGEGRPVTSVAWGAWAGRGMHGRALQTDDEDPAALIDPAEAPSLFDSALRFPGPLISIRAAGQPTAFQDAPGAAEEDSFADLQESGEARSEARIIGIWRALFGIEDIEGHSDFFELGGHSLLGLRMMAEFRKVYGIEASLGDLLRRPTPAEMARWISSLMRHDRGTIPHCDRTRPLALSHQQQRLWFLDQIDASVGAAYNMVSSLRMVGPLDPEALRRAMQGIVHRHESLRTRFEAIEGRPIQVVMPEEAEIAFDFIDLSESERETAAAQAIALSRRLASESLDLSAGPLLKTLLIRLDRDDHALVVVVHHIVSDGWSLDILFDELAGLYRAELSGKDPALPALTWHYADYAAWQAEQADGDELAAQLSDWIDYLQGAPALIELPTDRPRPLIQSYRGGKLAISIEAELTDALRGFAKRHGTTLFMALLAAWSTLLSRLSGQRDIVIGTPIANRNRPEFEPLIGFFVNTLPLRMSVASGATIAELLEHSKDQVLTLAGRQEVPFERMVDRLQPERSLSYHPVFQTTFSFDSLRGESLSLHGVEIEPFEFGHESTKFDLMLTLSEGPSAISGQIEFAADLFDRATVERWAGHFANLLEAMVAADSSVPAGSLPIMGEAERRRMLEDWSEAKVRHEADRCVHQLFEAQAERSAEAVAVTFEGKALSYGELNARANRLAAWLRVRGVGPDVRVAICAERSPEMVVGVLAVLKAGGAYVPFDPSMPAPRLADMLADSAPAVALTHGTGAGRLREALAGQAIEIFDIARDAHAWADLSAQDRPAEGLRPDHLAYVIYTSGSTGRPKGVMVEHRNLTRLFLATGKEFGFGAGDTWTLFHSLSFDFSVWEIWGALAYGGRLVVVPQPVSRSPSDFHALLNEERVTVLNQTPSAFRGLVSAQQECREGHALRLVIFGGEALDPSILTPWFADERNAATRMVNMYGITETTVHVTRHDLSTADTQDAGRSLVGRPIEDLDLYILDEFLQPVPVGVAGEMFVAGAGLARGYLNRPQLTAERFLPNPYRAGERMYRTGDLGRRRADGLIDYVGRNDSQVKIRGFRIELGEIEAALRKQPAVAEAVVLARPGDAGADRLIAYFRPAEKEGVAPIQLRQALAAQLPDYMVPAAFVEMREWPLTQSGKLDISALPAPDADAAARSVYEEPSGALEQALAEIWRDCLGLDRIGRFDKFFEVGGDSLRSISVVARARASGLNLSAADIFIYPTIAALAAALASREAAEDVADPAPDPAADIRDLPDGVEEIYDATLLQKGMFFLASLTGRETSYLDVQTLRLSVRTWDEGALRRALDLVSSRHPTLRTSFENSDGLRQVVHAVAPIPLTVIDLARQTEERQRTAIGAFLAEERGRPFPADGLPLLRAHVHVRGEGDIQFTLSFFHAILDGLSLTLMLNELFAVYGRLCDGSFVASEIPPPPSPRLGLEFERKTLANPLEKRFWQDYCEACAPTALPKLRRLGEAADDLQYFVPDELSRRLNATAAQLGVPLRTVLLCAHMAVVAALSGKNDPVSGTVMNVRPEVEGGDEILGLFLNTVPFRLDLGRDDWKSLILETYEQERRIAPHRAYPYAQIVADNPGRAELDAIFNFIDFESHERNAALESFDMRDARLEGETGFGLATSVSGNAESIVLAFEVDKRRFDAAFVESLKLYYASAFEAVASDLLEPWHSTSLLGAAERDFLLYRINDTQKPYSRERLMHHGFEQMALRSPDATALICGDERWSYAKLEREANRIARCLRSSGVGNGDRVATCFTRSPVSIAAMIAVLKAGAAYVPLDPTYPDERIRTILKDCSPRAILTETRLSGASAFEDSDRPVLIADGDEQGDESALEPLEPIPQTSDDVAYVIFTSGSTGKPKGVVVQHHAAVNLFEWAQSEFGFGPGDRVLFTTSYCFDLSVFDVFGILWAGGSILIASDEELREPGTIAGLLCRGGVTFWDSAPAALSSVLPYLPGGRQEGGLRLAFLSGDWIPLDMPRQLRETFPDCEFIALGGATEATVWSNYYRVDGVDPEWASIPYGRPIQNARYYVLDSNREPVPIGVEGDLYIGGDCLALGYHGDERQTGERFTADPFVENGRIYRTGDRARIWRDGLIEFLGRLDDQVKIRGFRIELAEVRSALLRCEGVRDAAPLVRRAGNGERSLVAYYIAEAGHAPTSDELRKALLAMLPEYMVPSLFVAIDAWPLTRNGKVDHAALPVPDFGLSLGEDERPRDEVERALAEIWSELLAAPAVGRNSHFLELGGHSLTTVQLAIAIGDRFGLDIPISALRNAPILSAMADIVRETGDNLAMAEAELAAELEGKSEAELSEMLRQLERSG